MNTINQFTTTWQNTQGRSEQGPLSVLWELIDQQQVDIFHVSLLKITNDFFQYIQNQKFHDLQTLSEFIYIASLLIQAKSEALLPKPPTEKEDNIIALPKEIITRLLEYRGYKKQAEYLGQRAKIGEGIMVAQVCNFDEEKDATLLDLECEDLFSAYLRVIRKIQEREKEVEPLTIQLDQYSVTKKIAQILTLLDKKHSRKDFYLFLSSSEKKNIFAVITLFLALLELAYRKKIKLQQDTIQKPIYVCV